MRAARDDDLTVCAPCRRKHPGGPEQRPADPLWPGETRPTLLTSTPTGLTQSTLAGFWSQGVQGGRQRSAASRPGAVGGLCADHGALVVLRAPAAQDGAGRPGGAPHGHLPEMAPARCLELRALLQRAGVQANGYMRELSSLRSLAGSQTPSVCPSHLLFSFVVSAQVLSESLLCSFIVHSGATHGCLSTCVACN